VADAAKSDPSPPRASVGATGAAWTEAGCSSPAIARRTVRLNRRSRPRTALPRRRVASVTTSPSRAMRAGRRSRSTASTGSGRRCPRAAKSVLPMPPWSGPIAATGLKRPSAPIPHRPSAAPPASTSVASRAPSDGSASAAAARAAKGAGTTSTKWAALQTEPVVGSCPVAVPAPTPFRPQAAFPLRRAPRAPAAPARRARP